MCGPYKEAGEVKVEGLMEEAGNITMDGLAEETVRTVIRSDGTKETKRSFLVKEHSLSICINDEKTIHTVCSDEYLKEMTVGCLFTSGYISGKEEIKEILFDDSRENVNVVLQGKREGVVKKDFKDSKDKVTDFNKIPESEWKTEWIFETAKYFSKGMPVHNTTLGTHACILAHGEEILFTCEDFGRRNTVLKAIGYAILNGINLSECFLFISGRVLADMMYHVIHAGIPLLASKAVPTADAVSLAKEYGVTLIVKAYPDQIEICE